MRRFVLSDAFKQSAVWGFVHLFINIFIFTAFPVVLAWLGSKLKVGFFARTVSFPVDSLISRCIELLNSLPRLLIIITIAAVVEQKSIVLLMVIIGATSWSQIARFTRAELLKVKQLNYIESANALGLSTRRIIFKHALPNALAPVIVTAAFGVAAAILIESGLSFLNIGVPEDAVTWGSLLSKGRQEPEATWLIFFPGLLIFLTVTVYNLIGEGLRDALDPKLRK